MDFKVAGTADFVTALQLDTKIDGLPADVLAQALQQAKEARLQILEVMTRRHRRALAPRCASTAPKIISFEIPMDKIGEVIGPKGKVINAIQQETGADISVDDDGSVGTVTIGSMDGGAVDEAKRRIELILNPPTAEVGAVYTGQGRQHHQVRCVRQHPSRAATAWSTSPRWAAASASTGWRTSSTSATRSRCGSTTSTRRARSRSRPSATTPTVAVPPPAPSAGRRSGRADESRAESEARRRRRRCRSRTRSTPRSREEFGDLGPGRASRRLVAAAATVAERDRRDGRVAAAARRGSQR